MEKSKNFESDNDIDMAYSRFRLWVSFKNGRNKPFPGKEKDATYRQIGAGIVNIVTFDHEKGLERLIYLAETLYQGKYYTAIIYDKMNSDTIIRKYVNSKLILPYIEIKFSQETKYTRYQIELINDIRIFKRISVITSQKKDEQKDENQIKEGEVKGTDIKDAEISNNKVFINSKEELLPNFKDEVNKALSKPIIPMR